MKSHDGVPCNFTFKDWSVVGVGAMQGESVTMTHKVSVACMTNGDAMKKGDELVWVQSQNPNKATQKKKCRMLTWKDDVKQQTAAKRRRIADRAPAVAGSSHDANAGSAKEGVVTEIIDI